MKIKVSHRSFPAYKDRAEVNAFIEWLAELLGSNKDVKHEYTNRQTAKHWQFCNLHDAYEQYEWHHSGVPHLNISAGSCADSNAAALEALAADLGAAACDDTMLRGTQATMSWGGVSARNNQWLEENRVGLAVMIEQVAQVLRQGNLDSPKFCSDLRFNAGMTKVYSLICENFIIYDSRVAAALGWLVMRYCSERKLTALPEGLRFPWAPAKEAQNATAPKNRDPGNEHEFKFPRLRRGHHHALWNMRASWVLSEALAHPLAQGSRFHEGAGKPVRKLEMGLFMMGYDLGSR
ncbi:TPA: hypothetical protein QEM39_004741 [Pseudomonas putida]|uniref:hypothetical protein n=1 Tax=Pseudomonas putida TaxID=303 RepID=UPI00236443E1|nr:hypothetical protein [Pseudomonas putida]MDD2153216.1 hypothetical protein [Pseudomonas putida]HDS1683129.1 hypothetical protein [Pseudomonas putida]